MHYCKICNKITHKFTNTKTNTLFHHCESCQFISKSSKNYIEFHEERVIYNLHNNSIEDEKYVDMFRSFLNRAVIPFKSNGRLLDFGSGPEPVLIQLINNEYNFATDHYDLHYAPNKESLSKKYDVIVSTEVIEHIKDPMDLIRKFNEMLNDGGIFSFMTLYHYNDHDRFLKWWYQRDKTHISFYNDVTLEKIAMLAGFTIIYSDNKRVCTFKKSK